MRFIKRNIFSLVALIVIVYSQKNPCCAQNEKGQININAGIGFSLIDEDVFHFGTDLAGEGFNIRSVFPAYNGTIDYNIGNSKSLGVAVTNQCLLINTTYSNGWTTQNINYIASRTNFAFRYLYHLNRNNYKILDDFFGLRVGYSFWNDKYDHNGWYALPSIQFLFGISYYFLQNFGIHGEFGIGTPYLAEGGLTFRINTRKSIPAASNGKLPDGK